MTKLLSDATVNHLETYAKLILAYSGGIDSEVLLDVITAYPNLKEKLILCHINHQLSNNANHWQSHCQKRAKALNVPISCHLVTLKSAKNLEAMAREKRYAIFKTLVDKNDALLTAHHQDDNIETFFLNLCRGSGLDGLTGIKAISPFSKGQLIRPLLQISQQAIKDYAKEKKLSYVDDESNRNCQFNRNFLRLEVIPKLKEKWPNCDIAISRSMRHLNDAKDEIIALNEHEIKPYLDKDKTLSLEINKLSHLKQKRLIRYFLQIHQVKPLSEKRLETLIETHILAKDGHKAALATKNYTLYRYKNRLHLVHSLKKDSDVLPQKLKLSQMICFNLPLGKWQLKKEMPANISIPDNAHLELKYRQGEEIIYLNNQHKKVKKLLNANQIYPWHRDQLPLLFINDELAAIGDTIISDNFSPKKHPHLFYLSFK